MWHLAPHKILRYGAARQLNLLIMVDYVRNWIFFIIKLSDIHAVRKYLGLNIPLMEGHLILKLLPQGQVLFLA